jgi:hypothetical protein
MEDFDFKRANNDVPAAELDEARDRIVAALA